MYSSVELADSYIKSHYTADSEECSRWDALTEDNKKVYLNNAFDAIEALHFKGRKAFLGQEKAFPRLPYQYGKTEEGAPARVVNAEIELALWLSDEKKQKTSRRRSQLIADGVKSFSVGDLSESYGEAENGSQKLTAQSCKKAMELLAPYLSGGFGIC